MPIQPPPEGLLRAEGPPDDQLLVVRGGPNSLNDANLERATADCWDQYGFFGISVFGAPDDDLVALCERVSQLRRRREVRVARCRDLRQAGFEVAATFTNPLHFDVVLPDATASTFTTLRSCFSEPMPNPGFERDR